MVPSVAAWCDSAITYAWLDLEATREGLCARGLEAPLADLGMAGSSLVS